MTLRARIVLRIAAILVVVGLVAYAQYGLNQVTALFAENRIVTANFYTKLIRENWSAIKDSDANKQALLDLLKPELLTSDLQFMKVLATILLYGLFFTLLLNESIALYRLVSKRGRTAP